MKSMIKDTIILTCITLLAGLLLGVVYDITKEPIALQEKQKEQEAYLTVFPGADSFEEADEVEAANAYLTEAEIGFVTVDKVITAYNADKEKVGSVLQVTSSEGYAGDISIAMGVTLEGTLNGISILAISETAGLGMKAEDVLVPQFENKTVPTFSYTKTGATQDSQIDAISGATITTNAFTNMVNAGLSYLRQEGN